MYRHVNTRHEKPLKIIKCAISWWFRGAASSQNFFFNKLKFNLEYLVKVITDFLNLTSIFFVSFFYVLSE